ncbi:MAG: SDR family NAD(P)-dependent oxidoreductase [Candidatus Binatia bacterium]
MKSLNGKVAIVTGGGGGIGKAISLLFAQEGAKILIADISLDAARRVARKVGRQTSRAVPLSVDVTKKDSVREMVAETLKLWRRIDILVNVVGGSFPKTLLDMEEADWDAVVDLNLKSVYSCCRAVLPAMVERRYGKIVNFASAQAFTGSETRANYTAAKLGVVGLSKSLALEVIRFGINVNVVAPGLVATERVRSRFSKREWQDATFARPMGRAVSPEEIARTVLFLVQDAQASITGQTIHVNGGAVLI